MKTERHRHVQQIIYDTLRTINKGSHKKTVIMYKANLSHTPMIRIINMLTHLGLITETTEYGHKTYYITDKGKQYIQLYDKIRRLL